jgi:hypothetical protein
MNEHSVTRMNEYMRTVWSSLLWIAFRFRCSSFRFSKSRNRVSSLPMSDSKITRWYFKRLLLGLLSFYVHRCGLNVPFYHFRSSITYYWLRGNIILRALPPPSAPPSLIWLLWHVVLSNPFRIQSLSAPSPNSRGPSQTMVKTCRKRVVSDMYEPLVGWGYMILQALGPITAFEAGLFAPNH